MGEAGDVREIRFEDSRTPHEVRVHLERKLRCLFHTLSENPLVLCAAVPAGACRYRLTLCFEAALPRGNFYSFRLEPGEGQVPDSAALWCRKAADGWFRYWTQGFGEAAAPAPAGGRGERYAQIVREALTAEDHLRTVEAIQLEITQAMRQGAAFSTSNKEGGTVISFQRGRFVSAGYGESSEVRTFADDAAFLGWLREFYGWEASRKFEPERISEADAWRIILRLMAPR